MKNKPILHLNLISRFYQMIELGIKTEEYREQKPYWNRIFGTGKIKIKGKYYHPTDVIICFSNGYKKSRPQMFLECKGLNVGFGKQEWGAIKDKQYYILNLGNKLKI